MCVHGLGQGMVHFKSTMAREKGVHPKKKIQGFPPVFTVEKF
jgi:hypothetical protein